MKFKLIETVLIEDIAAVKKQYSHIPEEDFYKIIKLDPTFDTNRDSVGKYSKWLLGLYKKDNPLNNENVIDIIQQYDKLKNDSSKKIEKDINKFKSLKDMYTAVKNAEDVELSGRQKLRRRQANKDYDLVWQNDNWAIFVPNTWEADVNLGKGTKWCTADSREEAGKKYYDLYLESGGKYYVVINKHNKEDKYQFHFESEQFMDKNDFRIEIADFVDAPSANGMRDFFKREGYDVDDYFSLRVYDEVIDMLFNTHGANEISVQINNGMALVMHKYSKNWFYVFALSDFMNGFSDVDYFYKNIITPCSKIIINELYDTFDYFNFKLVDEVANNQNLQEQLLKKFNKIILDHITEYNLEDIARGESSEQPNFKLVGNNMYITMVREELRNKLIAVYDNHFLDQEFLDYGDTADDIMSIMVQVARTRAKGVSNKEAVILNALGKSIYCKMDIPEIISNLIFCIIYDNLEEIVSRLDSYLESNL